MMVRMTQRHLIPRWCENPTQEFTVDSISSYSLNEQITEGNLLGEVDHPDDLKLTWIICLRLLECGWMVPMVIN